MAEMSMRSSTPEIPNIESAFSGVSWGAIWVGAIAAVAVSLVLFTLGPGLGLTAVSPFAGEGASAATVGVAAGIWLIVVQWLSSALGGYLAGRMRAKWAAMQSDEVFFRDTAHGFLAWGLATVITATVFIHVGTSTVSMGASAIGGAAQVAGAAGADDYAMDALFRSAPAAAPAADAAAAPAATPAGAATRDPAAARAEAGRIFARGLTGDLTPEDRTYLAQLISGESGLSQADAEARIDQTIASARETADAARQAAASAAILLALALAVGAFIGTAAGGLGGRHRDEL